MPEETKTINPVTPDAVQPAAVEETKIEKFMLNVRNTVMPWITFFQKHRGKAREGQKAGDLEQKFRPDFDVKATDPFSQLRTVVGVENFNREIIKLAWEIADDAVDESVVDGKVHAPTLATKFCEGWLPGTRRTGTGKKQIKEKMAEIQMKLQPFMKKTVEAMKAKQPLRISPQEELEVAQLLAELGELSAKLEKKERKGIQVSAAEQKAA